MYHDMMATMSHNDTKMRKRRRKTSKEERVCPICSQSFNKAEHLLRHVRSHTKEKPFECSACGRMYARQDTLLRHSRSHQQESNGNPVTGSCSVPPHALPISPSRTGSLDDVSIFETATAEESSNPTSTSPATGHTVASDFTMPMLTEGIRHCDLLPYWNFDDDPQRPYFDSLLSNNLELGDLNIPLLNSSHGESFSGVPLGDDLSRNLRVHLDHPMSSVTPESSFKEPDSAIQRAWHTYCSNDSSSGYVTPDPGQVQYGVDEDCHRDLESRLQPRLQSGTLPSTSFLDLCVQAYLSKFHPLFPIIHASTFRPHSQNGLLLLSMCSVGSLFIGSSKAISHGINMFERLHKAILSTWDSILSKSESVNHKALQASVIGQMFGLLVGRSKDLAQVQLFHGTVVVWSRKLNCFRPKKVDPNLIHLEGQDLETAWKSWIRHEERTRTALALLLEDAEISRLFHETPLIKLRSSQWPMASSSEAFAARDAVAWRDILIKEAAVDPTMSSSLWSNSGMQSIQLPDVHDSFGLYVLLERIGAEISENSTGILQHQERETEYRNKLVLWYERYHDSPLFQVQAHSLMMLWHSLFMLLRSDLDILESSIGRDGVNAADQERQNVEAWVASPRAKQCLIHAALLQKQFERISIGSEAPIHAAGCLYRCGVTWYCYARFGGAASPESIGQMSLPELECLGIDGTEVFHSQVLTVLEKPLEATLLSSVDLLKRINHWKVSDRFASTLLALVDDGQGLY